jgi:hypothetical protein
LPESSFRNFAASPRETGLFKILFFKTTIVSAAINIFFILWGGSGNSF